MIGWLRRFLTCLTWIFRVPPAKLPDDQVADEVAAHADAPTAEPDSP